MVVNFEIKQFEFILHDQDDKPEIQIEDDSSSFIFIAKTTFFIYQPLLTRET